MKGIVRNNMEAGVIEPAMSKVKIIQVTVALRSWNSFDLWHNMAEMLLLSFCQFATEAAITILRIDDMIKLIKDESQNDQD